MTESDDKNPVVEPSPTGDPPQFTSPSIRQQRMLADLGVLALKHPPLSELLDKAAELAAKGLNADYAKVLEYIHSEKRLVVRAGFGWGPGIVGVASVGADRDSPGGFALRTGKPVISNHLENEERFRTPELLAEHGIRRAMNVILQGDNRPYGVLEVDSTSEGEFVEEDIAFLVGAANILGMAIDRHRREESLRRALELERMLLKEINHRVKNSLNLVSSMLSLQSRTSEDQNLKNQLDSASSRVVAIARAYERLYQTSDFENLDIGAYLEEVCNDLPIPEGKQIVVQAPAGLMLSTDRAVPLALIIVELATNALKYAYNSGKGIVWVRLALEGDVLVAGVRDHGRGLGADFSLKRGGIGMQIVSSLARQLDAGLTLHSADSGASFELRVPLHPPTSG